VAAILKNIATLHEAHLRHASHYLKILREADRNYYLGHDTLEPGLKLFDSEWSNIQEGQAWARDNAGHDEDAASLCINFPYWGAHILDLRIGPRERICWLEAALTTAHRLNNRDAESRSLNDLGLAYWQLGEIPTAIEFFEKALAVEQQDGDRRGEMHTLINLGNAYSLSGAQHRAIEFYKSGLRIAREMGYRRSEALALGNLGLCYRQIGDVEHALELHEESLVISQETGDRRGEANALGNIASL